MQQIKSFILSLISLFCLWLIIAGTAVQEVISGAVIAFVISLLFRQRLLILSELKLSPASILRIPVYIVVFLYELAKSALDVARRVLSPSLPINPGIVKVRTKLKTRLGRIVLANSITLTPGTMTVETKGEYLYIHWIDIVSDDIDKATEAIVHTFEKHLEVIFG